LLLMSDSLLTIVSPCKHPRRSSRAKESLDDRHGPSIL
jgi:hypothetical protein